MRKVLNWTLAGVLGVILAGCATGGGPAATTCESCRYAVPDKKTDPAKIYCVVDGKQIDCRTNPGACPGCKK